MGQKFTTTHAREETFAVRSAEIKIPSEAKDTYGALDSFEKASVSIYFNTSIDERNRGDDAALQLLNEIHPQKFCSEEYITILNAFENKYSRSSRDNIWAKAKLIENYVKMALEQGVNVSQDTSFLIAATIDFTITLEDINYTRKEENMTNNIRNYLSGNFSMCAQIYHDIYDEFNGTSKSEKSFEVERALKMLEKVYENPFGTRKVDKLTKLESGLRAEVCAWLYLEDALGYISMLTKISPEIAVQKYDPDELPIMKKIISTSSRMLDDNKPFNFSLQHTNTEVDSNGVADLELFAGNSSVLLIDVKSAAAKLGYARLQFGGLFSKEDTVEQINAKIQPPMSNGSAIATERARKSVMAIRVPYLWAGETSSDDVERSVQIAGKTEYISMFNMAATLKKMDHMYRKTTRRELFETVNTLLEAQLNASFVRTISVEQ